MGNTSAKRKAKEPHAPPPIASGGLRLAAIDSLGTAPLTARAVADLCGVEMKTVHNWVDENRIAHFRTPGRHLRFQIADVVKFLERCGYRLPQEHKSHQVIVLVRGAARPRLRRILKGHDCSFVAEPLSALVVAARRPPDAFVVELQALSPLGPPDYFRVLQQEFPNSKRVYLTEGQGNWGKRLASLGAIALDDDRLEQLLDLLT